jgi:O-antigen ligase
VDRINHTSLLAKLALATLLATPFATGLSRNIAFPMLILATALLIAAFVRESGWHAARRSVSKRALGGMLQTSAALLAVTTLAFALSSLGWSPVPERGFGAVAQTTAAALAASLCCVFLARSIAVPSWLIWALLISLVATCVLILSELTFDFPVRSALGASLETFRLNRSAVALALLLPLMFIDIGSRTRLAAAVLVAALIVWTVFRSESESAKLALIVIAAVALLSLALRARALVLTIGTVAIASHILAPAIAILLYRMISPEAVASLSSILTTHPDHFIRLEIWWAYAQEILNAPLFGQGLQASFWARDIYEGENPVMLRGLSYGHPHNASIQTWYELGLAGVVLTAGLLILLLRQVLRMDESAVRAAAITIAVVWSVAYVSHGAWQGWWWALVGIVAILLVAIGKFEGERAT